MDRLFSSGVLYANACGLIIKLYELGALVDESKSLIVTMTAHWLVHDFDVTLELLVVN